MQIIERTQDDNFPFKWIDMTNYPNSNAEKREIYLTENEDVIPGLMFLFYSLFGEIQKEILVYDACWWDLCLDTWNLHTGTSNYDDQNISTETKNYLQVLKDADIPRDYSGTLKCNNWDAFLPIVLQCVVNHLAPYSPMFYSQPHKLFFYFHHTGSIGIYYQRATDTILNILKKAHSNKYIIT